MARTHIQPEAIFVWTTASDDRELYTAIYRALLQHDLGEDEWIDCTDMLAALDCGRSIRLDQLERLQTMFISRREEPCEIVLDGAGSYEPKSVARRRRLIHRLVRTANGLTHDLPDYSLRSEAPQMRSVEEIMARHL